MNCEINLNTTCTFTTCKNGGTCSVNSDNQVQCACREPFYEGIFFFNSLKDFICLGVSINLVKKWNFTKT